MMQGQSTLLLLLLFSPLLECISFRFTTCWQATSLPRRDSCRFSSTKSNDCNNNDDEYADHDWRCTLDAALAKMAVISETNFSANFNKRRISAVEVKESSIPGAGLGLFAKKQIKAGTIISLYPVHTLGIDLGESIRQVSMDTRGQTYDEEGEREVSQDQSYLLHIMGTRLLMKSDIVKDLGGESIFLNVDINQQETPGFHSHRVNDGAIVLTNSESGVLEYYKKTRQAKNCVHVPWGPSPLMATVATRKIKKGSELFTSYGCSCTFYIIDM